MTPTRALTLFLIAVVILGYPSWRYTHRHESASGAAQPAEPPVVVSDAVVTDRPWQDSLQAFGQIRAVQGADLSAQVPGIVDEIDFRSGDEVKAGTVLMRLRLYDDSAKLQQLQALVSLWQANVARDRKQFAVQAISQATLDLDNANLRQYEAQVAAQEQQIEQKIVRAPFSGKLGIRQVDLGQYLPAGTTIANIEALDHLYVDFNVVQQDLSRIADGQSVDVSVDSWPNRVFHAKVVALDSHIDQASRMVSVRADLDNPDRALLPGMFAVAHLNVGSVTPRIAVPQGAISFNPYGNFVYVLTPDPKRNGVFVATSRVVTLGARRGDLVLVEKGLNPGDRIVTAGLFKLRNGSAVTINNDVQPADSPDPTPEEE
ncbi:efflux RND transporter periplasmic adaptor subunit [Acetobacteraceae bacterium KSS8]|uniref:Efflux RND transporter periplasmic adaptor subunit n=1 Tax=Endosaccharibacter trunci TaxID=2812733 RepID=A0ABT1W7C1_9PROT|nr:efflux RND transporter periplasmic adaptor subunit [Acetobacteraceae bacterium KSS8]